jgi:hypothetical protein
MVELGLAARFAGLKQIVVLFNDEGWDRPLDCGFGLGCRTERRISGFSGCSADPGAHFGQRQRAFAGE